MMPISDVQKNLLAISMKDLLEQLNADKKAVSVSQNVCLHVLDSDEEVQVQLTITREPSDFIPDFQTNVTYNYNNPK